MKLIALAAAFALGGTAIAQDQQSTTTTTTVTTDQAAPNPPVGGYAPATPLFSSGATPPAGARVMFVPNPQTATEAFPPPAPMAHYSLCKRGQTDNCRQRGG
ncbi:hypothetical protein IAG41_00650 [Sphingomonas sp. JC676]|uniref:hypothetical protein n=1 Tax=Sphingomonas sp. JC676 TaxID=2768065 RepID=UPI0016579ABB|nr:hypothetical protein [Sphingomonas sp. JC676]MBC9030890.1 hypothetical protein [Sphingomonas sp. JC676]